jgi:light-regulated signal transduction histidine kinase (bacteriophytochrome)
MKRDDGLDVAAPIAGQHRKSGVRRRARRGARLGSRTGTCTFQHIFQAFHTTKPDGLGLGLSICRLIIEAHGGRLWASANQPHGAVFQFTVPTHSDSAS